MEARIDAAYAPLAAEIARAFCDGTSRFSWLCRGIVRAAARITWTVRLKSKIRGKCAQWIDAARDEVNDRADRFAWEDEDSRS